MVKRGVVIEQARLPLDTESTFKGSQYNLRKFGFNSQYINPSLRVQQNSTADIGEVVVPTCTYLDLEDLKCFETVERQYEKWGIVFHNCIAIQPSNPAFPTHSGLVVLMGAPKNGFLKATFLDPVHFVSAFVTSSQQLVFSAYDNNHQLLAETTLPRANLASSDSTIPPNTLLSVTASNIHYITFCAFDGQFTVDDLSFCS